jgi:hypothetical protein
MTNVGVRGSQNWVQGRPPLGRRVAPRRALAIPLNVTVLRSGVPEAVPGRSVDLAEGGLGVVLAAELQPGELVGVEFRLPGAAPVLAKARVCYQERLRCGLQFLAISAEQKAGIEAWASGRSPRPSETAQASEVRKTSAPVEPPLPKFLAQPSAQPVRQDSKNGWFLRRKIITVIAASVIVAAAVGWWQWQQAWQQLESRLPGHSVETVQSPVQVDWEVMQRLLVHDAAMPPLQGVRLKGVAVLSAVIGRDGSVIRVRPVSGPGLLTRTAMDSVQWWKFEPYRMNGAPVEAETTLAIEFR